MSAPEDEIVLQDENLRLAELCFKAKRGNTLAATELKAALIERKALPFLRVTSQTLVRYPAMHTQLKFAISYGFIYMALRARHD
jgi:hypothetical protein